MTAKVVKSQNSTISNPIILAAGTSPQSKFLIKFQIGSLDSVQVFIKATRLGTFKNLAAGDYILKVTNVPVGSVDTQLIGYKNRRPFVQQSTFRKTYRLNPAKNSTVLLQTSVISI